MSHCDLLHDIAATIDDLFADTSVPRAATRESLEEIQDQIESMLETLRND